MDQKHLELKELIINLLTDPKELQIQILSSEQVKNMAILTTVLNMEKSKFRDKLIEIRSQMDIPRSNMIAQSKQQLTKLIKELQ